MITSAPHCFRVFGLDHGVGRKRRPWPGLPAGEGENLTGGDPHAALGRAERNPGRGGQLADAVRIHPCGRPVASGAEAKERRRCPQVNGHLAHRIDRRRRSEPFRARVAIDLRSPFAEQIDHPDATGVRSSCKWNAETLESGVGCGTGRNAPPGSTPDLRARLLVSRSFEELHRHVGQIGPVQFFRLERSSSSSTRESVRLGLDQFTGKADVDSIPGGEPPGHFLAVRPNGSRPTLEVDSVQAPAII